MIYLRQSTASQEITFGYMVDSTDGNTEETGLTIANTDLRIWKAGATTLANKNSGGATHIANGIYYATLDATDTDTLGSGKIYLHVSGALYAVIEFCVLPANIYDSWILGTDYQDVNAYQHGGTTQTGRDIGASVLLSSGTGTGQVSLSSGTVTAGTVNDKTGYTASTVSDKTGYSLSVTPPTAGAIADAVWDEVITSGHGGVGSSGLTLVDALGYSTATRTALTDNRAAALDRVVGTIAAGTHNPQSGDAYAIVNNGTYGNSALETIVDDLETRLSATRAGYLDKLNITGNVAASAEISALNDFNPASDVVAHVTLVDTTTTNTDMRGTNSALLAANYTAPPSSSSIADAVWDEVLSAHLTASTTGNALNAAGAAGDPWTTALPGAYGSGTAGKIIGDNINATISSRSTLTAQQVWEYATRTLSSFGTLIADIWSNTTRTLSAFGFTVAATVADKTGYSLTITPATAADITSALNTYDPPTKAELDAATTLLANYIDTEIADIRNVTEKLDDMLVQDSTVYKFTANALEEAPGGGSGGSATVENQELILAAVAGVITHGDANWLSPSGVGGTIAVTFNIKDDSGNNVLDAWVEVWDTAGTSLKERKLTNSSGNASFNLDADPYVIRITKTGYTCTDKTYTASVPATVNYVMTAFIISPSADPEICRLYTRLRNPDNTYPAAADVTGIMIILDVPDTAPEYYSSKTIDGIYNPVNGIMYFDVVRTCIVDLNIPGHIGGVLTVPDLDTEDIKNVI